jgi:hypothetical protein
MPDAAMVEFLHRFPVPGRGTFFCHRYYSALEGLDHELAPHPFIDNLGTWRADLEALAGKLPVRPHGARPHSCVFSHMVGVALHEMGYRYVSQANNMYEPGLRPFRHPWGVWELPIYYMDNMDFWMSKNWPALGHQPFSPRIIEVALEREDSLFVFDIHPLHVALNTRGHEDYVSVKERIVTDGESPFRLSFEGRGTRVFFQELCEAMHRRNVESITCIQALERFGCLRSDAG